MTLNLLQYYSRFWAVPSKEEKFWEALQLPKKKKKKAWLTRSIPNFFSLKRDIREIRGGHLPVCLGESHPPVGPHSSSIWASYPQPGDGTCSHSFQGLGFLAPGGTAALTVLQERALCAVSPPHVMRLQRRLLQFCPQGSRVKQQERPWEAETLIWTAGRRAGGLAWPEGSRYHARAPGFGSTRILLAKGAWRLPNPLADEDKHQPRVSDSLLLGSSNFCLVKAAYTEQV